jgi:hypothetical protein
MVQENATMAMPLLAIKITLRLSALLVCELGGIVSNYVNDEKCTMLHPIQACAFRERSENINPLGRVSLLTNALHTISVCPGLIFKSGNMAPMGSQRVS